MTSFPQLLAHRELNLPSSRRDIARALQQKTKDHLILDLFHSKIIQLQPNFSHRFFINHDFVAILSLSLAQQKVQKLALWSLSSGGKLWDIEISPHYESSISSKCILSESGMVLVTLFSPLRTVIVMDGKKTGELPDLDWIECIPIGKSILGCWVENQHQDDQKWFFDEYNHEGILLSRYCLDCVRDKTSFVCSENFWVCLSSDTNANLASVITIIDRDTKTIRTLTPPQNPQKERFPSACIFQNQLFYAKNEMSTLCNFNGVASIETYCNPTICIYDLVLKRVIKEYTTDGSGIIKQMIAKEHFLVWIEIPFFRDPVVKFINLLDVEPLEDTRMWYVELPQADPKSVLIKLFSTILSITYTQPNQNNRISHMGRIVMDLTTQEIKQQINYEGPFHSRCGVSNESMLIMNSSSTLGPQMYIENFTFEGPKRGTSSFRINPE